MSLEKVPANSNCPDWKKLAAEAMATDMHAGDPSHSERTPKSDGVTEEQIVLMDSQIDTEMDRVLGDTGPGSTLFALSSAYEVRSPELETAGPATTGWEAALRHQRTCGTCREAAIAADPTVIFQRLPQIELTSAEIEAMRHRVAGVRRGRLVAGSTAASPPVVDRRRRQPWTAAAALLAMVLLGSFTAGWPPSAGATGLTAADEASLEAALGSRPLVDGINVYGNELNILMQGAADALDFAWVADGDLEP